MNRRPIDYSAGILQLDSSQFTALQVEGSSVVYQLSHHHSNELSEYRISFDAGLPVDSNGGCFIKYTFPPEVGTSQIRLDDIHGMGMLVSPTGAQ